MKVNENDPTFQTGEFGTFSNMPIRLEIATRLLAGILAKNVAFQLKLDVGFALVVADELIKQHNLDYDQSLQENEGTDLPKD